MRLVLSIAIALLAVSPWVYGQADFTSGLAGHWQAEGNGKDAAAQWHGRLQDVTFGPGAVGQQAFRFANPNRSAVLMDAAALDEDFDALSVLAWVNAEGHGHSNYDGFGRTIISRTEGGGFALRVIDGQVQFDLRTEGGTVHKLRFSQAVVPLKRWTHLAAVYDGHAAQVYVDGVPAGEAQSVSGRIKRTTLPGALLVIGNEPGATPQQPGPVQFGNFGWQGLIDDVRCYRRALDAQAVRACYESTRPAVVETPLPKAKQAATSKTAPIAHALRVVFQWRDPALFALLLWTGALLIGARVWRSLAICAGISASFWCVASVSDRPFIFHPGAPDSILFSFGLVAVGYVVWRKWGHRIGLKSAEQPVSAAVSHAGRLGTMLFGAVACCVAAFPVAFLVALFWRLPIPFGKYESGIEGAGKSWFAVLFYGAVGGFALLGIWGAIGGAIAHQRHTPNRAAVLRLTLVLASLGAALGVGLLSVLDKIIGPW
ncbi:MAG: LamG domain-containing protein [Verrucomicrobiaceae bacterium]